MEAHSTTLLPATMQKLLTLLTNAQIEAIKLGRVAYMENIKQKRAVEAAGFEVVQTEGTKIARYAHLTFEVCKKIASLFNAHSIPVDVLGVQDKYSDNNGPYEVMTLIDAYGNKFTVSNVYDSGSCFRHMDKAERLAYAFKNAPADYIIIESASQLGWYRVVSPTGEESSLYRYDDCIAIIDNAKAVKLLGSFDIQGSDQNAPQPAPATVDPVKLRRIVKTLNDSHASTGGGFYVDFGKGGCARCWKAELHEGKIRVREIQRDIWLDFDPEQDSVRNGYGSRKIYDHKQ